MSLGKDNDPNTTSPTPAQPTPVIPHPSFGENRILGVDVSKWQPVVDWPLVYRQGNRFAFAKATDGKAGMDAAFSRHRFEAKAAGLIFGGYHYFRFKDDPIEQAKHFLAVTGGQQVGELPLVCDVEWDKYWPEKYGEGHEMDAEAAEAVAAFLRHLFVAGGLAPMVYTNFYFWNPGRMKGFEAYPLWVPAYHTTIEKVKIPKPWVRPTFWQFSETENIGGVEKIDGDYFFGTMDELKKLTRQ